MKKLLSALLVILVLSVKVGAEPQGSSYIYIASLTSNETLVTKATVAVAQAATYVLAGGGSPCAARLANARAALDNPRQEATQHFMWYVALNTDVQTNGQNSTDTLIKYVIDTYFVSVWGACS